MDSKNKNKFDGFENLGKFGNFGINYEGLGRIMADLISGSNLGAEFRPPRPPHNTHTHTPPPPHSHCHPNHMPPFEDFGRIFDILHQIHTLGEIDKLSKMQSKEELKKYFEQFGFHFPQQKEDEQAEFDKIGALLANVFGIHLDQILEKMKQQEPEKEEEKKQTTKATPNDAQVNHVNTEEYEPNLQPKPSSTSSIQIKIHDGEASHVDDSYISFLQEAFVRYCDGDAEKAKKMMVSVPKKTLDEMNGICFHVMKKAYDDTIDSMIKKYVESRKNLYAGYAPLKNKGEAMEYMLKGRKVTSRDLVDMNIAGYFFFDASDSYAFYFHSNKEDRDTMVNINTFDKEEWFLVKEEGE